MGNDVVYKIVGIGTIRMKMHDGIVRTLTNVWHIPDLKKNLISLGTLDSLEYKYSDEGGVIQVIKVQVIMKCNKVDGLYFLQDGDRFNCCVFFKWSRFRHYPDMAYTVGSYEWEGYDNPKQIGFALWQKNMISWLLWALCVWETM